MTETFIVQDLYLPNDRKAVRSGAKPLTCYICKKELNGISITAKNIKGKMVFLCSSHYESTPQQIISAS
jgi:hypothetical protein